MARMTLKHNGMTHDQITRMMESNAAIFVKKVSFRGDLVDVEYDELEPPAIAKSYDELQTAVIKAFDALGDMDDEFEEVLRERMRNMRRRKDDE